MMKIHKTAQKADKSRNKAANLQKTHLYWNNKRLKTIPKFGNFVNLTVLYLHNNEIIEIENLENLPTLISLYLQNNRIVKIANLGRLNNLKNLYLGLNSISVVENLENLHKLEELHLEKQNQICGNTLCFDPRTTLKIADTLRMLNISNNKLTSISTLTPLKFLTVLNAANNDFDDVEEICQFLSNCQFLREASFTGNPIAKERLYQEKIVAATPCLKILDNKEITEQTRIFLKKLHEQRVSNNLRKSINLAEDYPYLPKNYPIALQQAVSASIMRESRLDAGDDNQEVQYIIWSALPQPRAISKISLHLKNQQKSGRTQSRTFSKFTL